MTEEELDTRHKSWKREAAIGLLVVLVVFAWWAGSGSGPAMEVLKTIITPIMLFAAGAFGMDAYAEQIRR